MAECAPSNIKYSENEAMVPLQDLLNKSSERLCKAIAEEWNCEALRNLELYVTVGFDSSSGHLNPHQKYTDTDNVNDNAQQSLLVTSCIIQKLKRSNEKAWTNPTPQSIRFCRSLRYYSHLFS